VLLRASGELVLVSPSGQELDRVSEPAAVASATLIGYRP
jgi:hypothetical protein